MAEDRVYGRQDCLVHSNSLTRKRSEIGDSLSSRAYSYDSEKAQIDINNSMLASIYYRTNTGQRSVTERQKVLCFVLFCFIVDFFF